MSDVEAARSLAETLAWIVTPQGRNPHQVTRDFESALCEYTGAPYAVACTSCTAAIQGALACWRISRAGWGVAHLPKLTYVGVPAAARNSGFLVEFYDLDWQGEYIIEPTNVWDSARRFTSGMYRPGAMQCVSFHASKILGDSQGGAVLLDDPEAAEWLRRYFFDGRTYGANPKTDQVMWPSMHAYMSPDVAARLLWRLSVLPKHNPDLPRSDYPRLDLMEAFK
jgi:dTDP-4-amino-4,6-dideoxygalactose transaminase